MVVPKLTLTYFGFGGRAEPIRLAATVGGVAFTNKAVDFKEFAQVKASLPLGQLPILEIEQEGREKITLTQSEAILRYFGRLGGLYPDDPLEATKVDSILGVIEDSSKVLTLTVQGAVSNHLSDKEWTADEKMAIRKRVLDKVFPKSLGLLNDTLETNGTGWLVGDTVTIADVRLYQLSSWIKSGVIDGLPISVLEDYPNILAHAEKVGSIPQVVDWKEKHPQPYSDFEFVPS